MCMLLLCLGLHIHRAFLCTVLHVSSSCNKKAITSAVSQEMEICIRPLAQQYMLRQTIILTFHFNCETYLSSCCTNQIKSKLNSTCVHVYTNMLHKMNGFVNIKKMKTGDIWRHNLKGKNPPIMQWITGVLYHATDGISRATGFGRLGASKFPPRLRPNTAPITVRG